MKYKLLFVTGLLIIVLTDCSERTEKESESNYNTCTKYACPIHSDKTSTTATNCPECNTQMISICDSLKKDSLKFKK